jgi:hypothetical protein
VPDIQNVCLFVRTRNGPHWSECSCNATSCQSDPIILGALVVPFLVTVRMRSGLRLLAVTALCLLAAGT